MSSGELKPATRWETVTASDSTVTDYRSLYVLTDGNLNLEDELGNTEIFPVTTGQVLPVQPKKVMSTSTTATCLGLH